MAYRAKCQSVTEEIKKANRQILSLQEVSFFHFYSSQFLKICQVRIFFYQEQRKMIDMVKQENEQKIHDLEKQVR